MEYHRSNARVIGSVITVIIWILPLEKDVIDAKCKLDKKMKSQWPTSTHMIPPITQNNH